VYFSDQVHLAVHCQHGRVSGVHLRQNIALLSRLLQLCSALRNWDWTVWSALSILSCTSLTTFASPHAPVELHVLFVGQDRLNLLRSPRSRSEVRAGGLTAAGRWWSSRSLLHISTNTLLHQRDMSTSVQRDALRWRLFSCIMHRPFVSLPSVLTFVRVSSQSQPVKMVQNGWCTLQSLQRVTLKLRRFGRLLGVSGFGPARTGHPRTDTSEQKDDQQQIKQYR
jgi:hypothetical protein